MRLEKSDKIKWILAAVLTIAIIITAIVATVMALSGDGEAVATVDMPTIKIYIRGEIKNPGLYEIDADVRLCELIELAGGATENADLERLNLAAILTDGTTVKIPAVGSEEEVDIRLSATDETVYAANSGTSSSSSATTPEKITSGTININTAGVSELMRLPGVGEATAKKIISYRESSGGFLTIEEIMNVSGIGQKTFEKMKEFLAIE